MFEIGRTYRGKIYHKDLTISAVDVTVTDIQRNSDGETVCSLKLNGEFADLHLCNTVIDNYGCIIRPLTVNDVLVVSDRRVLP